MFTNKYNEDIKKYGDPVDSGIRAVLPGELEDWQIVVQKHAEAIEPPVTNDTEEGSSRKRARTSEPAVVDPDLEYAQVHD